MLNFCNFGNSYMLTRSKVDFIYKTISNYLLTALESLQHVCSGLKLWSTHDI